MDRRRAQPAPPPLRRAVAVGLAGVVAGVALFGGVTLLVRDREQVRLGDDVFEAGDVEVLAAAVERDGPILFPDASPRRQRDIYVQHLGDDPLRGWVAFAAQVPGAERTCVLEWRPDERRLHDPCGTATFPSDGAGLPRYATRVDDDGRLEVDLRRALDGDGSAEARP